MNYRTWWFANLQYFSKRHAPWKGRSEGLGEHACHKKHSPSRGMCLLGYRTFLFTAHYFCTDPRNVCIFACITQAKRVPLDGCLHWVKIQSVLKYLDECTRPCRAAIDGVDQRSYRLPQFWRGGDRVGGVLYVRRAICTWSSCFERGWFFTRKRLVQPRPTTYQLIAYGFDSVSPAG